MPYYPQSPGFYPPLNSVTDGQLVDMPDGTVKGRALGAGLGDPTNLTAAQLQAIHGLGYPMVRHDCRFAYINGTTCRLVRANGALITINAQLCVIPAAGIDLAFNAGWGPGNTLLYVYAWLSGGVIVLGVSPTGPTFDARDGNLVLNGDTSQTLVGAIVPGLGSFIQTALTQGVISYWNRMTTHLQVTCSGIGTGSTTPVGLTNTLSWLTFGQFAHAMHFSGNASNNVVNALISTDLYVNGGPQGFAVAAHDYVTNGVVAVSLGGSLAFLAGFDQATAMGYVNAGVGTWNGKLTVSVEY
jgi:hypothetical protein